MTVGLNPSLHEFPTDVPFRRFPLAERNRDPRRYLDAMSDYFCTDPYRIWFSTFQPLLEGLGSSYYKGAASTALHTDSCSPLATNPTWSKLGKDDCAALEAEGVPLWHKLLQELRPQIVAISVARAHLKRIKFRSEKNWKIIHAFNRKADGTPRAAPYKICARWHTVRGERSLFVFGGAAQKPFGLLADSKKREAGELLRKEYWDGR